MKVRYMVAGTIAVGSLAIALIIYTISWNAITSVLSGAPKLYILYYVIISLLIATLLTIKWHVILDSQRIKVPFHRLFAYRTVGYSIGYLTPTAHVGGEPIRAYLLQREGVHVNRAFSTVIIDKSIELLANVVFFFLGALLIINSVEIPDNMKLVLLSLSLILILLMGMFIGGVLGKRSMFVAMFRFLRMNRVKRLQPIEKNLAKVEKQIEAFYKNKPKHFVLTAIIMVSLWSLMFLEYYVALKIIGHDATLIQIFLILTGVGLAYAVPIPAAMGTLELGQLSAAKVLNLSAATGIALALIIRIRDVTWTIIGLAMTAYYQFSFTRLAKKQKEIDKEFEKGDLFRGRA
jgi:glycosyltransferase 2 family protein